MESIYTRSQNFRGRFAVSGLTCVCIGLMLPACDKIPGLPVSDPGPHVEIVGPLTVSMSMGTFDPNRGRTFGAQNVMVEYQPDQYAIIYTSAETRFVNLERKGEATTYALGKKYRVRGYEAKPVTTKHADGTETFTAPSSVDRWIDATHVELLELEKQ